MDLRLHRPFTVAIDGYSSCGKSTLAKQLAKKLHFVFIDSGAMYRAVTLYFLSHAINPEDAAQVKAALDRIEIKFQNINGTNVTFLNGENVEEEIRSLKVSNMVSEVAAISAVRQRMVALQRQMVSQKGLIMDGRDIGTVVFPDADIKFFVTADPIVRAQRRFNEMLSKNQHANLQDVISNLEHRDKIDSERQDSPLRIAPDAIVVDNTHLNMDEQFNLVLNYILNRMKENLIAGNDQQ